MRIFNEISHQKESNQDKIPPGFESDQQDEF